MSDPVLFEVPAVGVLFDTRPFEAPAARTGPSEGTVAPPCPVCGGQGCACDALGHRAGRLVQ